MFNKLVKIISAKLKDFSGKESETSEQLLENLTISHQEVLKNMTKIENFNIKNSMVSDDFSKKQKISLPSYKEAKNIEKQKTQMEDVLAMAEKHGSLKRKIR